jgi:lactoylglutathione lyase
MSPDDHTPISSLFEAHLTVQDLNRGVAFYEQDIGLSLAHFLPERRVAFFWIGARGRSMLGLWEAGTMPITVSQHVAFEVSLADLHKAPERLERAGIKARDFVGQLTEEPVVLAWMPAAAVYFHDPDSNLLEFITMLSDEPRPDLGVLPWSKWLHRMPTDGSSVSKG